MDFYRVFMDFPWSAPGFLWSVPGFFMECSWILSLLWSFPGFINFMMTVRIHGFYDVMAMSMGVH